MPQRDVISIPQLIVMVKVVCDDGVESYADPLTYFLNDLIAQVVSVSLFILNPHTPSRQARVSLMDRVEPR